MQEETSGGQTTINQYPNNGWNGGPWGGYAYPAVPAYGYAPAYNGGLGGLDGLMRGFGGNINFGGGGKALGTVGTVLGAVALGAQVLQGGWRGFGGPNGGPGGPGCDFVTQRELSLVRENGTLAAENGQLKAQIYTDNKTDSVIKTLVEWRQRQELIDTQTAADVAALKAKNAQLEAQLGGMLGTYIQPGTFAPSQAVFAQIQAAAAAKSGTAPSGN